MTKISIVIPTLGDLAKLQRLLHSIYSQSAIEFTEVIIVINAAVSDEIQSKFSAWKSLLPEFVKVFYLTDKGVNIARNYGFEKATSDIVLYLDDDCELLSDDFIEQHLNFHQADRSFVGLGGGYLLPQKSHFYDQVYNYRQMKWLYGGIDINNRADFLLGGNFSVKRSVLLDAGINFDQNIIYGGSEYEFFKKMEKYYLPLKYIELDVAHHTNESFFSLTRKIFKQGRGKAIVDSKFFTSKTYNTADKNINLIDVGFSKRALNFYLDYIFWAGYYQKQGKFFYILIHALKECAGFLNLTRYRFFNWLNDSIKNKKNKGERF